MGESVRGVAFHSATHPTAAPAAMMTPSNHEDSSPGVHNLMSSWPPLLKHLTPEQAWEFVHDGASTRNSLSKEANLELASLSAFGQSRNPPERLSNSVDTITARVYPRQWNPEHVRRALIRLGIPEP